MRTTTGVTVHRECGLLIALPYFALHSYLIIDTATGATGAGTPLGLVLTNIISLVTVDPVNPDAVLQAFEAEKKAHPDMKLSHILTTHKHWYSGANTHTHHRHTVL